MTDPITTPAQMRKARIERLLYELEHEIVRGVMEREIEPDLHFSKIFPCAGLGDGLAALEVHLYPDKRNDCPSWPRWWTEAIMPDQISTPAQMTAEQRDLARHALGLPNRRKRSYRNHFVTGEGSADHHHWIAMVMAGLARRRAGSPITGGDDLFSLTKEGAIAALDKGERLDPEDFA